MKKPATQKSRARRKPWAHVPAGGRLLSLKQVGERLGGRSRSSLYRDFEAGRLPEPIRIGGRAYVSEAALDAAIDALADAGSCETQEVA